MAHLLKTAAVIGGILSLLGLSACSSPTPTSTLILPTQDLNPFRTEVAATVMAEMSFALSQTPPATLVPSPTATIRPSSTPSGTATSAASASPGPVVASTGGTPVTGTINQAEWVSQSIADGTVFEPGETFTITWRIKNAGTAPWTPGYLLRFYSGDRFGAPGEILFGRDVPPGETIEISILMKAPEVPGNYRTDWVLSDERRNNFKEPVFFKFSVAAAARPTPTTLTPTTITPTSGP